MSTERLNAIIQMVPGWKETDGYEEDVEKTDVIEELLAELTGNNLPALQDR